MANEIQYSSLADTGATLTGEVYDVSGTQVGGTVTMTEVGVTGIFRGNFPTADPGKYNVRIFQSTTLKGQDTMFWSGDFEINLYTIWQLLANRFETDPADGKAKLYGDDDTTVILEALIYETLSPLTAYSTTSDGIERRNRLVAP